MAYTAPTVDDFLIRFAGDAALSAKDDGVVQSALDEAARSVDTSWREADYADAILYLSAHWLTAEGSADQAGVIKSESFGPISVSYGSRSTSDEALASTQYGERFLELRRGNFGAPVLVV